VRPHNWVCARVLVTAALFLAGMLGPPHRRRRRWKRQWKRRSERWSASQRPPTYHTNDFAEGYNPGVARRVDVWPILCPSLAHVHMLSQIKTPCGRIWSLTVLPHRHAALGKGASNGATPAERDILRACFDSPLSLVQIRWGEYELTGGVTGLFRRMSLRTSVTSSSSSPRGNIREKARGPFVECSRGTDLIDTQSKR
jgi:hypothetical protein